HHDDLGAEVDRRADVECVARKNHQIELRSCAEQPVELRQRVVQVSDNQAAHLLKNPAGHENTAPGTGRNKTISRKMLWGIFSARQMRAEAGKACGLMCALTRAKTPPRSACRRGRRS